MKELKASRVSWSLARLYRSMPYPTGSEMFEVCEPMLWWLLDDGLETLADATYRGLTQVLWPESVGQLYFEGAHQAVVYDLKITR